VLANTGCSLNLFSFPHPALIIQGLQAEKKLNTDEQKKSRQSWGAIMSLSGFQVHELSSTLHKPNLYTRETQAQTRHEEEQKAAEN